MFSEIKGNPNLNCKSQTPAHMYCGREYSQLGPVAGIIYLIHPFSSILNGLFKYSPLPVALAENKVTNNE